MGNLSLHFDKSEFRCQCGCGGENPSPKLIEMLEKLHDLMGAKAIIISSGYRCPSYSVKVGGYRNDAHTCNIAADLCVQKEDGTFYSSEDIAEAAERVGFEGIGIIDNDTGAIIAVGAGRNKNSAMSLNYATQISRHPGSTAKPIFDYGPGIEYKNWSTYTTFYDKPVKYTYGGTMQNVDKKYQGLLTLEQCLVRSRNTCALQAFQPHRKGRIRQS